MACKGYHISMTKHSEPELVLPALQFIRNNPTGVTTTDIRRHLMRVLHPSGEDMDILSGRSDPKISQIARNLKSHDTLTKPGWVSYQRIRNNGFWTITPRGIQYLRGIGL